jgi:ectoine hydroxylase
MWNATALRQYREDGYFLARGLLSPNEIDRLNAELPAILGGDDDRDGLHRERERSGAVRSVFLVHRAYEPYQLLARDPRILGPVKEVIDNEVYVWHSKINVKEAFEGAVWLWHQDFGYWAHDGVDSRFVSAMVLLDEATIHNGCLLIAAGSHRWGLLPHYSDTVTTSYKQWCVELPALKERLREDMIRPITGKPGDVLFFDPNLLHGSGHNMSPLPRKTLILCYNDIANKPKPVENPRPDWVVSRDFTVVS